jgi:glycosyltransferase involved in cell wall biosynthesis
MTPLSAVVIARDEEADIARTLEAMSFADEIPVVDSGSTDRTVEICRSHGARVLEHRFEGYGPQKRWAVERASHDRVLCLDADEVPTPELVRAIRRLMSGVPPLPAYRLTFHTVFMGRALSRGSIGRRGHVRLFDRRRAGWSDSRIHEGVEVDGQVGSLPGVVHHHNVRDLSEAVAKLDLYSRIGAEELARRGKHPRSAAALAAPAPYHFLRHWLLNGNVLNGTPGFGWAFVLTATSLMKHLKLRELADGRPGAEEPPPRRSVSDSPDGTAASSVVRPGPTRPGPSRRAP